MKNACLPSSSARSAGFTLIELVMVIVILGVLAAVALPRFVDLRSDAERAAVESTVGALASARTIWVVKSIICGSPYNDTTTNLAHVVDLGSQANVRCEPGNGIYTVAGHTFDAQQLRNGLMATPASDLFTDNPNQGNVISFVTKSGRTITITHTPATGNISWAAVPNY